MLFFVNGRDGRPSIASVSGIRSLVLAATNIFPRQNLIFPCPYTHTGPITLISRQPVGFFRLSLRCSYKGFNLKAFILVSVCLNHWVVS